MDPYVDKHGRNLHSIKPITFEKWIKCQIINAHMGAGKSHASIKFIKADAEAHPGVVRRILFVTCRIQQGNTLYGTLTKEEIMAILYSSVKGSLAQYDITICQVESLVRLQSSRKWDIVIVDEIRSILGQLTSDKTNKANMAMNNHLIRVFMRNADAVLLMDAHCEYDHMVKEFGRPFPATRAAHASLRLQSYGSQDVHNIG